jgi:hypothetical protein
MFNNTEYQKIWRLNNFEKHKKYKFLYSQSLNGIYIGTKYEAKKRKIDFSITKEDFIKWYNQQEKKCHYCGRSVEESNKDKFLNQDFYRLSIDRTDNNKGYQLNNIVLSCLNCNRIKSRFFTYFEMIKIGSVLKEIFAYR